MEAPLLSLLILMHQERDKRIDELREETMLQVALHNERELTLALRMIYEMRRGLELGAPRKSSSSMYSRRRSTPSA